MTEEFDRLSQHEGVGPKSNSESEIVDELLRGQEQDILMALIPNVANNLYRINVTDNVGIFSSGNE